MAEQKLTTKTGNITIAAEEEFDRQIDRWAAILVKERPELADGVVSVQDARCNGSKPTAKIDILIFPQEDAAMQYLAARHKAIGRLSSHAILKMVHNYTMERLAQAIKEAREG